MLVLSCVSGVPLARARFQTSLHTTPISSFVTSKRISVRDLRTFNIYGTKLAVNSYMTRRYVQRKKSGRSIIYHILQDFLLRSFNCNGYATRNKRWTIIGGYTWLGRIGISKTRLSRTKNNVWRTFVILFVNILFARTCLEFLIPFFFRI